jgi:hypothetical protein
MLGGAGEGVKIKVLIDRSQFKETGSYQGSGFSPAENNTAQGIGAE